MSNHYEILRGVFVEWVAATGPSLSEFAAAEKALDAFKAIIAEECRLREGLEKVAGHVGSGAAYAAYKVLHPDASA